MASDELSLAIRAMTSARVALGRTGDTVHLREVLDFQIAHARARDAVHLPFDATGMCAELDGVLVRSAARDRTEYLRRPDLGRKLSESDREALHRIRGSFDVVFVVADGLSPVAIHRNAAELLRQLVPKLGEWRIAPTVVVEQGRVAIGDEIGDLVGASLAVVLIGERPGLASPDSMGLYVTGNPVPGRTDAERNCISNVRPEGLAAGTAAELLFLLLRTARQHRLTGVGLGTALGVAKHEARALGPATVN